MSPDGGHRPGTRSIGTVVLAGGRAARLGGIAKPLATIGGATLLDLAIRAAPGGPVVVVGPPALVVPAGVRLVREDPPFGGPVAALAAGVAALPPETTWVLALAADQPTVGDSVDRLLAVDHSPAEAPDGVIGVDGAERRQPLAALYRFAPLRELLHGTGNRPHRLMDVAAAMTLAEVYLGERLDVDTAQDAEHFGVEVPMTRAVTDLDRDHRES